MKTAIKQAAAELGIDLIGFSCHQNLDAERAKFVQWLNGGNHAAMGWMERDPDARFCIDGTLISIGVSYHNPANNNPYIAAYAAGMDYHLVINELLSKLLRRIQEIDPQVEGHICVDAQPIAEKPLAMQAGIGWQGRNTLIINPKFGSYICLGELIINRDLEPDEPHTDLCGSCRLCIESCPTGAILEDRTIDCRRCISYLTIEDKAQEIEPTGGRLFGCNICQECCPHNANIEPGRNLELTNPNPIYAMAPGRLKDLSDAEYFELRKGTVFKRLPYWKLRRNLKAAGLL